MKIFSQLTLGALSLLSVGATAPTTDVHYHTKEHLGPSMWLFSPEGLTIYAPDGEVKKAHPKKMICQGSSPGKENDCYYFTYASDGHRYVWAGNFGNGIDAGHNVQAFDIDTGDYAGYLETCSTPLDLVYQTARREMYLRCAEEDLEGGSPGEIDVFSSATLSSDLPVARFNMTGMGRQYGRMSLHSSMGPFAYSVAYKHSYVTEVDLSNKNISAKYDIPKAYGAYDMTYSPVNKHVYFRVRVCCTCPDPNSTATEFDAASCGRSGVGTPSLVQTGPSASTDKQIGICGNGCEGSRADTIGVMEFDTVNKVMVDSHNIKEGTGWGADPVASPDGKWIVLMPNDGGQNVRIMQAGENGESSASTIRDIPVDFMNGVPGKTVVSDVAFIQDENREILVIGASTDNNIVLVDLNTFGTRKIDLSPGVIESTGGSTRNVEWAIGTDYVWINGGEAQEAYVVKIEGGILSAVVDRTITDFPAGQMIFVDNFERKRTVAMAQGLVDSNMVVSGPTLAKPTGSSGSYSTTSSSNSNSAMMEDDSSSNSDALGIVGIVLGSLGLVAGLGALVMVSNQNNAAAAMGMPAKQDVEEAIEAKSLGSKLVN